MNQAGTIIEVIKYIHTTYICYFQNFIIVQGVIKIEVAFLTTHITSYSLLKMEGKMQFLIIIIIITFESILIM